VQRNVELFRTSLQIEPGQAGAPVVNRQGEVVAIAYWMGAWPGRAREASVLPIGTVAAGLRSMGLTFFVSSLDWRIDR